MCANSSSGNPLHNPRSQSQSITKGCHRQRQYSCDPLRPRHVCASAFLPDFASRSHWKPWFTLLRAWLVCIRRFGVRPGRFACPNRPSSTVGSPSALARRLSASLCPPCRGFLCRRRALRTRMGRSVAQRAWCGDPSREIRQFGLHLRGASVPVRGSLIGPLSVSSAPEFEYCGTTRHRRDG